MLAKSTGEHFRDSPISVPVDPSGHVEGSSRATSFALELGAIGAA